MKKITIILTALVFVSFLFTSCRKAKEPEGKKETQGQTQKPEATQSEEEVKQQPVETKSEILSKQESTIEIKSGLVTDEERKKVEEKFQGEIFEENFENDKEVIEHLKILLKGNHKTFHLDTPYMPDVHKGERISQFQYGDVIRILLSFLKVKDAFNFAIEILKTKTEYPEAVSEAAKVLRFAQDKSVIPLLKEVAKHPNPTVRLEASGSLLSLGDADTALPILDELAEKEGYSGALYLLFTGPGKIMDERGYKIVEKALNNPKAEVRISAVKLLLESKKITKEKAEETALGILGELKDKTLKDYGLAPGPKGSGKILPLSDITDVRKAKEQENSDGRACEYTMNLLAGLKSKKAVPALKYIEKTNTEWWYVCWNNHAKDALIVIERKHE